MLFLIGIIVVIVSILFGYLPYGKISILMQPLEWLIIVGCAIGSFLISNTKSVIINLFQRIGSVGKNNPYNSQDYLELLACLYYLLKMGKKKGNIALENHLENPKNSEVLNISKSLVNDKIPLNFMTECVRMLSSGYTSTKELEQIMDDDILSQIQENHTLYNSLSDVAQSLPAFGIVAAVLGVITTMGSITEPPEILGNLIASALVGTFLGIFLSYAIVSPIANKIKCFIDAQINYQICIKSVIFSYANNDPLEIAMEFGRKVIPLQNRPSVSELDQIIEKFELLQKAAKKNDKSKHQKEANKLR